jgi:SWI/SNF related-matrix-associated actin-dependent regulator of chromatin subfamily C
MYVCLSVCLCVSLSLSSFVFVLTCVAVSADHSPEGAPLQLAAPLATRPDGMATADGPLYVCSSCEGPCLGGRYENLKVCFFVPPHSFDSHCVKDETKQVWESEITLCASCFALGKLPSGWRQNQFVARSSKTSQDPLFAGLWTQEETLALLTGLEKFGEDWPRVAQHVGGGKTENDCVLHFIRLPIQDQYMGSLDLPMVHASDNPALQLVRFISATLSPELASAAASAAVAELQRGEQPQRGMEQQHAESARDPREVVAVALGAAGSRAALLAEREAQKVATLLGRAIQVQLKALSARMARFGELEAFVDEKKTQLRREMLKIYAASSASVQHQ